MTELYTTRDLDLVIGLRIHEIMPVKVFHEGKRIVFGFEITEEFLKKKNDHYEDRLIVTTLSNGNTRRMIKQEYQLKAERQNNDR